MSREHCCSKSWFCVFWVVSIIWSNMYFFLFQGVIYSTSQAIWTQTSTSTNTSLFWLVCSFCWERSLNPLPIIVLKTFKGKWRLYALSSLSLTVLGAHSVALLRVTLNFVLSKFRLSEHCALTIPVDLPLSLQLLWHPHLWVWQDL